MAEADRDLSATSSGNAEGLGAVREEVAEEAEAHEETSRVMPHLMHAESELARLYPSLKAPPDEDLKDLRDDSRDGTYQHGLAIAEGIRRQTAAQGRRRRPQAGKEEANGAEGEDNDDEQEETQQKVAKKGSEKFALVVTAPTLGAPTDSASWRRRSARDCHQNHATSTTRSPATTDQPACGDLA